MANRKTENFTQIFDGDRQWTKENEINFPGRPCQRAFWSKTMIRVVFSSSRWKTKHGIFKVYWLERSINEESSGGGGGRSLKILKSMNNKTIFDFYEIQSVLNWWFRNYWKTRHISAKCTGMYLPSQKIIILGLQCREIWRGFEMGYRDRETCDVEEVRG